ncbi:uncharacterized protein K02A2.6-like [Macrosteles quadrilineatus]|uniref:uncharacterized protein K02A2.6-like n=1 Tax=Macrosteles quadrilineatus TaxID=74068 RepID=UPI0023E21266|nr:uncharacterized protein K02A2.6-like [Macrosteles quadrilineatus]
MEYDGLSGSDSYGSNLHVTAITLSICGMQTNVNRLPITNNERHRLDYRQPATCYRYRYHFVTTVCRGPSTDFLFNATATGSHEPKPNEAAKDGVSPNLTGKVSIEPNEVKALKQKYVSVFRGGPGEIKDVEARIVLKENYIPKFCKYRPVPYALRTSVEQEIDRMISEGIAYPVTSSQWATPIVVIQKKQGVRLCGDFKVTLNQVIQSEHYPLPQPEDIFASLAGCKCFSVLDLEAAYLQLAVAEESQELLTLATHKGLVRLRRLPYGLSSAPALFQAAMDKIIGGLPGTVAYLDDLLVGGSSREEALTRLEHVLQRLQSYGVKQSKQWVLSTDVLVHYDVHKPLILTCDASPRGVGAVLSHLIDGVEKPIAFASKSLSASEKNYSQLHKEALALVFGVKKFHKYIYGRSNVVLQTDHAPLVAIFGSKRGVPCVAAARLQRWALILSAYNFEVKYRRGVDLPHADALSRLPLPNDETMELEANHLSHVENVVEVFSCYKLVSDDTPITAKDIARLTDRDPVLSKVRDFIWHGWRSADEPELIAYFRRKDELSVDNNCVVWGARVVVPEKLRSAVIRLLHDQHPGISRMKMLARSYVWWPGLEKNLEETVSTCTVCQCTRNAAVKVPLYQWPRTTNRWQRIHIDYAEDPQTRQQLLVVVDSFSKWLEVFLMKSTTSFKTIERLRTLFAAYGLPEELVSDNAPNFTSAEFREFLSRNGIKFTLSPPYHPASNGAAERCVQEVKKNLQRQVIESQLEGVTLQHKLDNFLFVYRNTPSTVTGLSPAELFLQWKPRTKLTLLKPNLLSVIDKKKEQQRSAANSIRGGARHFGKGDKVCVKTVRGEHVSWVPGKVMEQRSPATYVVSVLGKVRFCHADHLRSSLLGDEEETLVDRRIPQPSPVKASPPVRPISPVKIPSPQPAAITPSHQRRSLPEASSPLPRLEERHEVQSSPQLLRRSQRAVRKPRRLDL